MGTLSLRHCSLSRSHPGCAGPIDIASICTYTFSDSEASLSLPLKLLLLSLFVSLMSRLSPLSLPTSEFQAESMHCASSVVSYLEAVMFKCSTYNINNKNLKLSQYTCTYVHVSSRCQIINILQWHAVQTELSVISRKYLTYVSTVNFVIVYTEWTCHW